MAADYSFFCSLTAFTLCPLFCSGITADSSFIFSSMAFPTVCTLYYLADVSGLLILPLVYGFHTLRAVLLREWQQIAHFLYLLSALTMVYGQFHSLNGSPLPILPLVNSFQDGLLSVLLHAWHQIACSSACQWLSCWFACSIAAWIATYCSFFRSSTSFTVYMPLCSADGSRLLHLPFVIGFHDGVHAILPHR